MSNSMSSSTSWILLWPLVTTRLSEHVALRIPILRLRNFEPKSGDTLISVSPSLPYSHSNPFTSVGSELPKWSMGQNWIWWLQLSEMTYWQWCTIIRRVHGTWHRTDTRRNQRHCRTQLHHENHSMLHNVHANFNTHKLQRQIASVLAPGATSTQGPYHPHHPPWLSSTQFLCPPHK